MSLEKYLDERGPEFLLKLKKENGKVFWAEGYFFAFDENYVNEICIKQYDSFVKSIGWHRIREGIGDGLLTNEEPKHLKHRRILNPSFHINKINDHVEKMFLIISKEISKLSSQDNFNASDYFLNLSYIVLTNTLFDDQELAESKEFKNIFYSIMKKSNNVLSPNDESLYKYKERLYELISKIILKRMSDDKKHDDFLNLLIESLHNEDMSLQEVIDEILSMLLAGHETTANIVIWSIYQVAYKKDILEKIKQESNILDQNLKQKNIINLIKELKFSEYVIKETLRLYPPVWVSPREAIEDCNVGDFLLPKGTKIILSSYVSHREEEYFNNAYDFNPERWSNNFENSLPVGSYFPFHLGPRKCIGYRFGEIQAQITLLIFLKHFNIENINKIPKGLALSTYRPHPNFNISIRKVNL